MDQEPSLNGAAVANPDAVISPQYCCPCPVDLAIPPSTQHIPQQPIPQEQNSQQPIPAPTPAPNPAIPWNPVSVIGPQYCLPYPVDLALVRNFWARSERRFTVSDINENLLFKVKDKAMSLHDKRTILDPDGNPVVTIAGKLFSLHSKHFAFKGDSKDPKDLLFTVTQASVITWNVFLANNTKQEVCDFRIKGSWTERSCIIYAGETNTIVAQLHDKTTLSSALVDKHKFTVTVYPNTDYAFIVALIVILDHLSGNP